MTGNRGGVPMSFGTRQFPVLRNFQDIWEGGNRLTVTTTTMMNMEGGEHDVCIEEIQKVIEEERMEV